MSSFLKDPDGVLDYKIDWSVWLQAGETISTSTWIIPTGITQNSATSTTTTTTVWLSGGTDGTVYRITNRVTTSGGRTDDRTIRIRVTQR